MAKREVNDKNMMVGLCSKTNPLYSRCVRLSVLLLGVLTDIAMCALFFNMEPVEEVSFQFWDGLVENVWVAIYSVLLSLPFILFVVLSYRIPSFILRSFRETTSVRQLEHVYRSHSKRIQCHKCLGFFFFFLFSCFLALPLITLSSLKTNIGFYITCTYWSLLFLLGLLAARSDKKYLKGELFFQLLY